MHSEADVASPSCEPEPSQQTSETKPITLADMPGPWLSQFFALIASGKDRKDATQQISSLFCTSRGLRDAVLTQLGVSITVQQGKDPVHTHPRLLQACGVYANVRLELHGCEGKEEPAVLVNTAATLGRPLTSVTVLKLKDVYDLDCIVPSWVSTNLPNLQRLELSSCRFQSASRSPNALLHPFTPSNHPHLTEIRITCAPALKDDVTADRWKAQLCALSKLTSIKVWYAERANELLLLTSCVGEHLKHLKIMDLPSNHVTMLTGLFSRLEELHLPRTALDDECMDALLKHNHLRELVCGGLNLTQDYMHRTCRWHHVTFMRHCPLQQLGRLPLSSGSSISCVELTSGDVNPGGTPIEIAAVAEALCRTRRLKWSTCEITINGLPVTCLAAFLPMLSGCCAESLFIQKVVGVTPALLVQMGEQLRTSRFRLVSWDQCCWAPGAQPLLLPSLPESMVFMRITEGYSDTQGMDEQGLVEMCANAVRPVHVELNFRGWYEGQERAVAVHEKAVQAMKDAGHQYVHMSGI